MRQALVYIHGKGGNPREAEHYKRLFSDWEVLGFDYSAQNPWEALQEFQTFFAELVGQYDSIRLVAVSIGAYFALYALAKQPIEKAYLISPIVDMERLIKDMMAWTGVTEDELQSKVVIPTEFGDDLSWEYLFYVRKHPIQITFPALILYGEKDALVSYETISAFAERWDVPLTIMKGGEHWFHTKEQMAFLDQWIRENR